MQRYEHITLRWVMQRSEDTAITSTNHTLTCICGTFDVNFETPASRHRVIGCGFYIHYSRCTAIRMLERVYVVVCQLYLQRVKVAVNSGTHEQESINSQNLSLYPHVFPKIVLLELLRWIIIYVRHMLCILA